MLKQYDLGENDIVFELAYNGFVDQEHLDCLRKHLLEDGIEIE